MKILLNIFFIVFIKMSSLIAITPAAFTQTITSIDILINSHYSNAETANARVTKYLANGDIADIETIEIPLGIWSQYASGASASTVEDWILGELGFTRAV